MRCFLPIVLRQRCILRHLAGWVCVLAAVSPAIAAPLPFTSERAMDTDLFARAESVAAADIDRDGWIDIAAANTNAIVWWRNMDGSGTNWLRRTVEPYLARLNSVWPDDLDGDGDLDLAGAAGGATATVAWWRNEDDGGTNWTRIVVDNSFGGARAVETADVNTDGRPDILAAASTANELAWWFSTDDSGTNWAKRIIASGFTDASSIGGADIDGDGDIDIIGSAATANTVAWWSNNGGSGTNWIAHIVDSAFSGAQTVRSGDLDGDGDLDIAGAANSGDKISWWENLDGAGSNWTSHVVAAAVDGAYGLWVCDMDLDGDLDLLCAIQIDQDVIWYENANGDASTWTPRIVSGTFPTVRSAIAADIDHDGDLDVCAAAFVGNRVSTWENRLLHRSASYCQTSVIASNFEGAQSVHLLDLDRDGDNDLVGAAASDNRISWWENASGNGSVLLQRFIDTNVPSAWSVSCGDMNRDGRMDVLGASRQGGWLAWWNDVDGDGLTWSRTIIATNFTQAQSIVAADIDDDGIDDVVGAAHGGNEIAWWDNIGGTGTNWVRYVVTNDFTGATAALVADFDRDGHMDISAVAYHLGVVAWWRNVDGTGTNWETRIVDASFGQANALDSGDMDGDGDIDLIGASYDLDRITWWENADGTGINWTPHQVVTNADGASAVHLADLDADGDLDVVGGTSVDNLIAWWENDGSNTNWTKHALSTDTLDGADITTGDLNQDGKPDIVAASSSSNPYLSWWADNGGQFALSGYSTTPSTIAPGETNAWQTIRFQHLGREGDGGAELATLDLRFETGAGSPIDSTVANQLIEDLAFYKDSGSGVFEIGSDTLITNVATLALAGGVQSVILPDSNALVQTSARTTNTYFVVLHTGTAAGNQSFNQFRMTLATGMSTAEDVDYDTPLNQTCGYSDTVSTSTVIPYADISLTKTATPSPLVLDSNLVYYLAVSNRSVNHAWNVVVTDSLPSSVTFSIAGSSAGCIETGGLVVCNFGTITGLQNIVRSVAVSVHGSATGAITNTATAATFSTDTNLVNNTSSVVVALPDNDIDGTADFRDADDDNDGIPDFWELSYNLSRTNGSDASVDSDGDEFNNLEEFIADTNPTNSSSFFHVTFIDNQVSVNVYVASSTGRIYTLEYNADALAGAWSNVNGQVSQPGTGGELQLLDASSTNVRNYRVKAGLPP